MVVTVRKMGPLGVWDVVTEADKALDAMYSESAQKYDTQKAAIRAARRMADPGERIEVEPADPLGDPRIIREGSH